VHANSAGPSNSVLERTDDTEARCSRVSHSSSQTRGAGEHEEALHDFIDTIQIRFE